MDIYQTRQTAVLIDKSKVGSLIGNAFLARVIIGAGLVIIIYLISISINKPLSFKVFLWLSAIAMAINFLMGSFSSALLGYERFKLYGFLAMGTQSLNTILGLLVLYIGFGIEGIGFAFVAAAFIATIVIGLAVNKRVCRVSFKLNWQKSLDILKSSAPLAGAAILATIYYKADFIMLAFFKGDEAVGYYNSAYALISGLLLVSTSLRATLLPRMTGYFVSDPEKLNRLYHVGFKYMLYMGLSAAFGASILAGPIFELVYPQSYLPGAAALKVLIWALALMFVNSLQIAHLIARDHKKQLMYITGLGAVLNIALNFVLIPKYSFTGAASATVITETVTGIGFFYILRRHLQLRQLFRWLLRLLPPLIIMIVFLIFAPNLPVVLRALIGVGIIITGLVITRGLTASDLGYVTNLLPWGKN
jgi:O-antigen/teichoic acid export membrane protein